MVIDLTMLRDLFYDVDHKNYDHDKLNSIRIKTIIIVL